MSKAKYLSLSLLVIATMMVSAINTASADTVKTLTLEEDWRLTSSLDVNAGAGNVFIIDGLNKYTIYEMNTTAHLTNSTGTVRLKNVRVVNAGQVPAAGTLAALSKAAADITSVTAPAKDATRLSMPSADGFTVSLDSSSNPGVIAADGTIVPPGTQQTVNLVFKLAGNGGEAYTSSISVTVPAKTGNNGGFAGSGGSPPVSNNSSTVAINPATGGAVSLVNSASQPLVSLNIPAGALQGRNTADVAVTNIISPPSPPAGDTLVGAYEFTVNGGGYTFNSNVSLTFTFDPAKIPAGMTPVVEYYDNTSSQWVPVQCTVNGDTITISVNHFTIFAVMSIPKTQPVPATSPAPAFSDVPSSYWGYTAISSLSAKGIVSGYPDGTFKPDRRISRAEFAAMLVKALNLSTSGTTGTFTDVSAGAWYYGFVNAAATDGLVSGVGGSLFAPNALLTREQMAVMVAKALESKAPAVNGTELDAFSDKNTVSSWSVTGMEETIKAGIVTGITTDTLAPLDNATRAQAAAMIFKLLGVLGK